MAAKDAKILCETPTPGKQGTRIDKWKYDLVRNALRKVIPRNQQGVEFKELVALVQQVLTEPERERLGSLMWYLTTVKLHMECIGELERLSNTNPQRIRRLK